MKTMGPVNYEQIYNYLINCASTSNSISPRPYDIGPKLVSKSPHSSSIYAQHHSNVSSTSLPTHWDLVKVT
ncbi:hypothetical protein KEM48_003196 [Puccinia striiformis f. sp. tritici PST-130]|nr:hypothetical protein KEM48_003196 [Puccinia striiformis f. sp. tritici PST-130]